MRTIASRKSYWLAFNEPRIIRRKDGIKGRKKDECLFAMIQFQNTTLFKVLFGCEYSSTNEPLLPRHFPCNSPTFILVRANCHPPSRTVSWNARQLPTSENIATLLPSTNPHRFILLVLPMFSKRQHGINIISCFVSISFGGCLSREGGK